MTTSRLVGWIQGGLLALVALMPFHAFLSVWAGHLFGHQAVWQSWKEVLLVVLTGLTTELLRRDPGRWRRLQNWTAYSLAAFSGVAVVVTAVARPAFTTVAYGAKTDLEFIVAAVLAWLVTDPSFARRLVRVVIATSGAVIAFGLLQIYLLPKDWLVHFGYGAHTIQPYLMVDPAISAVRILSTLGGPNQLGSFLVLPLGLVLWCLLTRPRWWQPVYLIAGGVVMWHTYSRSALLGLLVAGVVVVVARLPRRLRLPTLLVGVVIAAVGLQLLTSGAGGNRKLQYYVFHEQLDGTGITASTDGHSLAVAAGLHKALAHPLGLGLGSAGPASYHGSSPFIPENNYLQLAIEAGLLGVALFTIAQLLLGMRLWQSSAQGPAVVAALCGIGVINIFLQGWADSSTALIFWTVSGSMAGLLP